MLYRVFLGSLLFVLLLLLFINIKGFVAANLFWTNEHPQISIEIGNSRIGFKRSHEYSLEHMSLPSWDKILISISSLSSMLGEYRQFTKLGSLFLKLLVIQKLEWKSVLGCEDAMGTAMANGTLWGIKGSVTAVLSHKSRIQRLKLLVLPEYSQKCFQSQVHCIFKMRIVHIIFVTIYFLGQSAARKYKQRMK